MTNALHLGVDAVGCRFGGGAYILRRLVEAILARTDTARLTLFASPGRRFALPDDPRLDVREPRGVDTALGRIAWFESRLGRAASAERLDVVAAMSAAGRADPVPLVYFAQQPFVLARGPSERLTRAERARFAALRALGRASIRAARLCVAFTPGHASALARLGARRVAWRTPDPAPLAPPPPGAKRRAAERLGPGPSIVYVGHEMGYKDLATLARAARLLGPGVIIAATARGAPAPIRSLGPLPPAEIPALLAAATALAMPSLAETIGLPMLESASVGTPVIAADLPYARDVMGDAASFFAPADPRALAGAASALIVDAARARALAEAGRARVAAIAAARPFDAFAAMLARAAARGAP